MKTRIRVMCLLLVAVLCAGIFAACDEDPADNSSIPTFSTDPNASDAPYGPQDYGPFPYADQNYAGSDPIQILCVETARHIYGEQQFVYIEENGENVINSEVKKRNDLLEAQYGITFEITPVKYPNETIKTFIDSNTPQYDLICESVDRLVVGINTNSYWSLDKYMNFQHGWWDDQAIESLALGQKHFLVAGAAILTDDDNTYLTLFNKNMYNENAKLAAYGNIYQLVKDGKFTIDLYNEMCKEVSHPDENGAWGVYATFGNLSHTYGATVMMNGCNIATAKKNEKGELYLAVMDADAVAAFSKVYDLMSDINNTVLAENIKGTHETVNSTYGFAELSWMFTTGRGLFYNTTASSISGLKGADLDFEFGVLPIPKYDENQENYCNTVNIYHSSALAIPSTVKTDDIPRIVFAMQALGYYNSEVIRAYYNDTLQLQGVQANDDAEMLDVVYNNRFYDIGAIYNWGSLTNLYGSAIADSTGNTLASKWEATKSTSQMAMNTALKRYNKTTT